MGLDVANLIFLFLIMVKNSLKTHFFHLKKLMHLGTKIHQKGKNDFHGQNMPYDILWSMVIKHFLFLSQNWFLPHFV